MTGLSGCLTCGESTAGSVTMACRMKTSRAALDRLPDPNNPSVTIGTLERAASALNRRLKVELR